MRLWLQVLFAQGYLWRQRLPEVFPARSPAGTSNWHLWWLLFGAALLAGGINGVVRYGAGVFDALMILTGAGFLLWNIEVLRMQRLIGSHAFWVSLSWGSGTIVLLGLLALTVTAALQGYWIYLGSFAAMIPCFFTPTANMLQRRYLFFADTEKYGVLLDDDADVDGIWQYFTHTYWRLPREVLTTMLRGNVTATTTDQS